jgi:hypothetical protein
VTRAHHIIIAEDVCFFYRDAPGRVVLLAELGWDLPGSSGEDVAFALTKSEIIPDDWYELECRMPCCTICWTMSPPIEKPNLAGNGHGAIKAPGLVSPQSLGVVRPTGWIEFVAGCCQSLSLPDEVADHGIQMRVREHSFQFRKADGRC